MTSIHGNNLAVVDSDALIGLIHRADELHKRCLAISNYLTENAWGTVVPYSIILEAATTLAKDKTIRRPDLAAKLLKDYSNSEQSSIDYNVSELVSSLYNPRTSIKNTPFDHYVLALAKKNNIKYVFSFDSFYEKKGLTLMEDLVKGELRSEATTKAK